MFVERALSLINVAHELCDVLEAGKAKVLFFFISL